MRGSSFGGSHGPSCQNGWVERSAGFLRATLWRILALIFATAVLAGCGTLPSPGPKPASVAQPARDSGNLADIAKASTPPGDLSGFRLLPLGPYALEARLQLVRRAQHSLDVQYYVIEDDATGRLLLRSLRDAAARGVRVRLLVDDLYTAQTDPMLRTLADTPTSKCGCSTPSAACANRLSAALPARWATSTASTTACTTSCSSPTG